MQAEMAMDALKMPSNEEVEIAVHAQLYGSKQAKKPALGSLREYNGNRKETELGAGGMRQ